MTERNRDVMQWILIILLSGQFLLAGFSKFTYQMCEAFLTWGYSLSFMYFIGTLEIIAAMCLFFKRSRMLAGFLFIGIMIGAIYTHWQNQEFAEILLNIGIIGLATIILWLEQDHYYLPDPKRITDKNKNGY